MNAIKIREKLMRHPSLFVFVFLHNLGSSSNSRSEG